MLSTLSNKYQKQIAAFSLYFFFLSFVTEVKAGINRIGTGGFNTVKISQKNHKRFSLVRSKEPSVIRVLKNEIPGGDSENEPGKGARKKEQDAILSGFEPSIENFKPLIGGPTQPEMSAFKSVNADNMVNLFTGDFSYNIPLLDVGGYPVNIFYNSGITMDQEASWVGLGWNINPGTVGRTMRGVPDDFNGSDKITKTRNMRKDETWGVNLGGGVEFVGFPLGLSGSRGISYNNRLGLAMEQSISASMSISKKAGDKKTANINFGVSLNLGSRTGATVTPSIGVGMSEMDVSTGSGWGAGVSANLGYNSRQGLTGLHVSAEMHTIKGIADAKVTGIGPGGIPRIEFGVGQFNSSIATLGGSFSFAYPSVTPTITMPLTRFSINGSFKHGEEIWGLHPHRSYAGYYTKTYLAEKDKEVKAPAYGMLYMQNGNNDKDALLDFNRIQDGVYTKSSPTIGMPAYSFDVYSITGEGTGGSFRAYRSDLGYVHDPFVKTREESGSIGLELGTGGQNIHLGGNLQYVYTPTTSGEWKTSNLARNSFSFKKPKGAFQSVYFKNPGEKAIPDVAYQNAIGGEELVRMQLVNAGKGTGVLTPTLEKINPANNAVTGRLSMTGFEGRGVEKARDKRTQVITCLTALEASRAGLDTAIYSYNPSAAGFTIFGNCSGINPDIERFERIDQNRKSHHISEIDVLDQDGKRYVYGIPVYNKKQVEVTMAIEPGAGDPETQMSSYNSTQDSKNNNSGRDHFYEKQELPPYAHSYLLTALMSPNYVDVKGDGITDDDMGDAVKFNYSKSKDDYRWRTPAGESQANFAEGLKTFPKDDKAHYVYGEREQWYLYSIESKNMVARFYVNEKRCDGRSVDGDKGGVSSANKGMNKLDKIELYSKADLTKQNNGGPTAKPVKVVHFEYDYSLCPNTPDNNQLNVDKNYSSVAFESDENVNRNRGKLTLKSIYFTYNGNSKAKNNKYVFHYPAEKNPAYSYTANDRWGNYKPCRDGNGNDNGNNLGGMTNADYPYAIQDKQKADEYVGAWTLNKITLPSGGEMEITYESDDYGFVQNKRAARMFQIKGFGDTDAPTTEMLTNENLYAFRQYEYIYLDLPVACSSKTEFAARYLADVKQLFMKLSVNMPPDDNGSNRGTELVPIYADIEDYGLVNPGGSIAYIKVKKMESSNTPMVQYSLQFMKNNLPHKAYFGYDLSETNALFGVFIAMVGMVSAISEIFSSDFGRFISKGKCRSVQLDRSFVRLSEPDLIKLGGGLRVKKVVIHDNWNKLTNGYSATYGQEYKYTTTESVNNVKTEISSGVAAWEPVIGGEENPHREIIKSLNRNTLGPFEYGATEMPMGEMFYPSPIVGYSRVEVNSIHRDTVKNAPGKTVTEYYTTREFPFKSTYSAILPGNGKIEYTSSPILKILQMDILQRNTLSQGFKIDMNDMNGREKSTAAYSAIDPLNPISKTTNYYNVKQKTDKTFEFNHTFPVVNGPDGIINPNGVIGRDIELMADFREHKSVTHTANITLNFDLIWWGIIPVPLFNPISPFFLDETGYRSAAVTKIVNHYAILDSVKVVDKGSVVSTKNLVYDAETGGVLLNRTNNEFDKPVYSFSYPAHWAYEGMGMAYKNIDVTFDNLTFRKGLLENNIDMSLFHSGDEIYVLSDKDNGPLKSDVCDEFSCEEPYLTKNPAKRIWAVNTAIGGADPSHFVFMDRYGQPYTAENVYVRIIRSGRRNMVSATVGSVTSLVDPIIDGTNSLGNPVKKVSFSTDTKILATSAITFKEKWRTDNSFYEKDFSIYDTSIVYPVLVRDDNPEVMTISKIGLNYQLYPNNNFIIASSKIPQAGAPESQTDIVKSFVRYPKLEDFLALKLHPSCLWARHDGPIYFNAFDMSSSPPLSLFPMGIRWNGHISCNSNAPFVFYNHPDFHDNIHAHEGFFSGSTPFGNNTILQSLKTPWYGSTDLQSWKQVFNQNDNYSALTSKVDFLLTTSIVGIQPGSTDPRQIGFYDPHEMITRMMVERRRNLVPNAAGFSFQIFDNRNGANFNNIKCLAKSNDITESCPVITHKGLHFAYFPCLGGTIESYVTTNRPMEGAYCKTVVEEDKRCLSVFTKKAINPYIEGLAGNWRLDTTYVYYGKRTEKVPTNPVDLRNAGTIDEYKNFWNFKPTGLLERNHEAADVWVWNSAITQYNRKGYEVENCDPLGRYNSGLYGYNQQLPVAITNNARVRETMFDGFEDYDYATGNCDQEGVCNPRRQVSFKDIKEHIVTTQRHTGKSSVKLAAAQEVGFTAPLVDAEELQNNAFNMRIKIDSFNVVTNDIKVSPNGSGFLGEYFDYTGDGEDCDENSHRAMQQYNPPQGLIGSSSYDGIIRHNETINYYNDGTGSSTNTWQVPIAPYFSARWTGFLQPKVTGEYDFKMLADNSFIFKIAEVVPNGPPVPLITDYDVWNTFDDYACNGFNPPHYVNNLTLEKGKLYRIEMLSYEITGAYSAQLLWRFKDCLDYEQIPLNQVYETVAEAEGTTSLQDVYCTQLGDVTAMGNPINDSFSLIKGKKMLVSAWVKEIRNTSQDCKCSNYDRNTIQVGFLQEGGTTLYNVKEFQPAGNIIEGWQRYESIIEIPTDASSINVILKNKSQASENTEVYFDDIRIHPYNANMKSFVYHPSNLRLTSELDENNYASFYEYDDEGTLVRVKKETIEGIKTIKETRSALQKKN